ncbi:hypothetical protein ACROYT_G040308 [Oculina patagonica]
MQKCILTIPGLPVDKKREGKSSWAHSTSNSEFFIMNNQRTTGEGKEWSWKQYATVGAVSLVGGTAAVAAVPVALSAVGFAAGGVAAGSIAAGIQSAVYGGAVSSTSAFATLQSVGAAGMGAAAKMGLFSAGAGAANYIKNKLGWP